MTSLSHPHATNYHAPLTSCCHSSLRKEKGSRANQRTVSEQGPSHMEPQLIRYRCHLQSVNEDQYIAFQMVDSISQHVEYRKGKHRDIHWKPWNRQSRAGGHFRAWCGFTLYYVNSVINLVTTVYRAPMLQLWQAFYTFVDGENRRPMEGMP